ncbi:elongator complex protein 2-like [Convolutriloba macropyga]|uniref:elongator complex protein 2-like n=1 Tax=Convolutriloba macropyga TaxID=536237 RepID=UPI003F528500
MQDIIDTVSSINVQFETCFTAVNRNPNCIKWIDSAYFVTAAYRSLIIHEFNNYSKNLSYTKAVTTLNGHDNVISCLDVAKLDNSFAVIASGDKKGNLILWNLSKRKAKWQLISSSTVKAVHKMSINCVAFIRNEKSLYLLTCGDMSVNFYSVNSAYSEKLELVLSSKLNLNNKIAFQIDALVTQDGYLFLFTALDDCCLHVYLSGSIAELGDQNSNEFRHVFKSEHFGDWIRGISLVHLHNSNCDYVSDELILAAVGCQDSFVQIFGVYAVPDVNHTSNDDNGSTLKKTLIKDESGKVKWNIFAESLLSAHTDKVFSVQFLPYNKGQRELALLSSSFDRSIVLWSLELSADSLVIGGNRGENLSSRDVKCDLNGCAAVWQDVMRVGDVGGNDLGFYGASVSPDGQGIVAYNYTGSILSWTCSVECNKVITPNAKTMSYSDLKWSHVLTSSGHFFAPTSIDWNRISWASENQQKETRASYFVTAGKDKIVRAMARINLRSFSHEESCEKESVYIWQEVGRPQVHGYEMNSVSLLSDVTLVSCGDEKVARVFDCTAAFSHVFERENDDLVIPDCVEISKTAAVPALGLSNKGFEDVGDLSNASLSQHKFSGNAADSDAKAAIFTNSHLAEKTLWSEKIKLYGHGNEVYAVTCFHSQHATLIATSCKATSIDTACILLWQYGRSSADTELCSSSTSNATSNESGKGHTLTVTDLQFSSDGNLLLSVSRDRSFCLFAVLLHDHDGEKRSYHLSLQHKVEHHKRIIWKGSWLLSDDNSYLFLTGSRDKSIILWECSKMPNASSNWLTEVLNEVPNSTLVSEPESKASQTFKSGVTALDVVKIQSSERSLHLVCAGLENGLLYLMKLSNCSFEIVTVFDSFDSHVMDVNCVKFNVNCFEINLECDDILWLTTASNDHIVKLFKIKVNF